MKIYKIFSLLDLKHKKNKNWKISTSELLRAIDVQSHTMIQFNIDIYN